MIRRLLRWGCGRLGVLLLLLVVPGCGGEAGLEIVTQPETPTPVVGLGVRGEVLMPNGALARAPSLWNRIAAAVVTRAQALVAGNVEPVGRNVVVRLLRIDQSDIRGGDIFSDAETFRNSTDDDGRYEVILPVGEDENTCRFMVQVGDANDGTRTRAFVFSTGDGTDISFQSEAVVRLIVEKVVAGEADLCDFDAGEIRDIYEAVASSNVVVPGNSVAELNAAATEAARSEPAVQAAIAEAIGRPTPPVTPATEVPDTHTPTASMTRTATEQRPTRTNTAVATLTFTATGTPTGTASATLPFTATRTATSTQTPTRTATWTATGTPTGTASATLPFTATRTATSTLTPTAADTSTRTMTATNTATATSTDRPTRTRTRSATRTPTVTPIPSATPTETPEPSPTGAAPELNIGSVAGTAGSTVSVPVSLVTNGALLAAVSNDIEYDASLVDVSAPGGIPDCAIEVEHASTKQIFARVSDLGGTMKRLRVGVIGTDNNAQLADGPLYHCQFAVDVDATDGAVDLGNAAGAADPRGSSVAALGSDGQILISGAPATLGLSAGTAAALETVTVTAMLDTRGQALSAVATDIRFDPDLLSVADADLDAEPDCVVAAVVGASFDKEVVASVLPPDHDGLQVLRVGLIGRDNNTVLTDTNGSFPVFLCDFVVETAQPGPVVLDHVPDGSSPTGARIGLFGVAGTITVVQ